MLPVGVGVSVLGVGVSVLIVVMVVLVVPTVVLVVPTVVLVVPTVVLVVPTVVLVVPTWRKSRHPSIVMIAIFNRGSLLWTIEFHFNSNEGVTLSPPHPHTNINHKNATSCV